MEKITVKVEGMSCDHCRMNVENALKSLDGILQVKVSLEKNKADITYDPSKVTFDKMKSAVDDAGYKIVE